MTAVWKWLVDNRTWVFDGFGVAIAAAVIGILWNRRKHDGAGQSMRAGDRSVNVQAGRDVALQMVDREDAAAVAVRESFAFAKENAQLAREMAEKLARARVSGERLIASTNAMSDSIPGLVASNKELGELAKDNLKLAEDIAKDNLKLAKDFRTREEELADRFDAAFRTLANMHLALSDETPEPDLAEDRDRIILARLYAYPFYEALEFYHTAAKAGLTAAEAGGPWPHLSPEAAARFRAIPEFGKPPEWPSTLDPATRERLQQRLAKLASVKSPDPNPSSGPDSEQPPSR